MIAIISLKQNHISFSIPVYKYLQLNKEAMF